MPECFNRASSAVTDKRYQQELWIPAFAGMTLPFDAIAAKVVEVPFK
jgi:hypothetical protein